jgi:hypothetical protein
MNNLTLSPTDQITGSLAVGKLPCFGKELSVGRYLGSNALGQRQMAALAKVLPV